MFDPANLQVYKAFVADDTLEDGTAKEWKYKSDLQAVIDAADAKLAADAAAAATAAALAAIQGYADADDASALTVDELKTAGGVVACGDANLALYKTWIADTSGTFIANADSLQWLIDTADLEALDAKGGEIDAMARANDASALALDDLCVVQMTSVNDALLA
jgi:hypothetical protein